MSAEESQQNLVLHFLLKPVKAVVLFSFQGKQIRMFSGQLLKRVSHMPNKTCSKQYQLLHNVTWCGKYHHPKKLCHNICSSEDQELLSWFVGVLWCFCLFGFCGVSVCLGFVFFKHVIVPKHSNLSINNKVKVYQNLWGMEIYLCLGCPVRCSVTPRL